jgi:hypothetical protein
MSTDMQVSHPAVSHPDMPPQAPTAALGGPSTPPATVPINPADKPERRTSRRKLRLPPPQVIAAAVLAVAALELLLWQVAGVWWGVVAHLILATVAVVLFSAMLARRRRKAGGWLDRLFGKPNRRGSTDRGGKSPSGRGWPFGKGSRAKGGPGASNPGGRKSMLGRLLPSWAKPKKTTVGGKPPAGGKTPAASRSNPGGKSPGGLLDRIRSPFVGGGKPKNKSTSGSPSGSGKNSGKSKSKTKGSLWDRLKDDLKAGFQEGTASKPDAEKTKPKDGKPAKKDKASDIDPAGDAAKEKGKGEVPGKPNNNVADMVKQKIETVAVTAPVVTTGGAHMGDMNKVRAAADELAAALKDYDPEDMHQLVREMPYFGEALNAVQAGIRQMASRAESEWPVAAPVAEAIRSIADDVKAGAGTAESAHGTIRSENETDIERGEAPRHGSMRVESKWNVNGNG